MLKDINDLSEKDFNTLNTVLSAQISASVSATMRLAKTYQLDKNELANYWLYLLVNFVNATDLNKVQGLTVEKGMTLLKELIKLKERKK